MDDQELLQIIYEQWDEYKAASWKEKLELLRHRFSM